MPVVEDKKEIVDETIVVQLHAGICTHSPRIL